MEKSGGGSELLQRQIADLREKCNEMEKVHQNKDEVGGIHVTRCYLFMSPFYGRPFCVSLVSL